MRQLRSLNVAFEKERTLNAELSAKLKNLQDLAQQAEAQPHLQQSLDTVQLQQTGTKALKDKLAVAMRKLEDERAANIGLKNALRSAQKALACEIGGSEEEASRLLEGIQTGNSGWKGRAQIICTLRVRILNMLVANASERKMQEKIKELSNDSGNNTAVHKPEFQAIYQGNIKKIAERRHEAFDSLSTNFKNLTQENEELKHKYDGVVARNRILEKDIKNCKNKLKILLEKASNDDKLVKAMHSELKNLRNIVELQQDSVKRLPKSPSQ
ncbi:Coiled-coil domain-containing protein 13 [Entophlyctis luteolus]|nr:Coiled-coil domain-containing protein 13 [Entophlyctis luteolus]